MAQEPQLQGPCRFGVFELDPRSGELRKNGVKLKLQEQPLQVLLMLLECPGGVVTREELRERLWPDGTFVDFDKGVNTAIQKLREVLDDSSVTPRLIETVPRRGYRFIYPVERPAGSSPAQPEGPSGPPPGAEALRRRERLLLGLTVLSIAAVAVLAAWMVPGWGTRVDAPVRKFSLVFDGLRPGARVSPDGKRIAYITGTWPETKLWVRDLDSWESRALAGTEGTVGVGWSPDGNWLAFRTQTGVKKVPFEGGTVTPLCEGVADGSWEPSVSWTEDGGAVLFVGGSPRRIHRVSGAGGPPRLLIESGDSGGAILSNQPALLPMEDRRVLLFRAGQDIAVEDLDTSERTRLMRGRNAVYASTGHILYQQGGDSAGLLGASGTLWAVPFSLGQLKATGEAFPIGTGGFPSVSNDGTLVYSLPRSPKYSLVWRDRKGKVTEVIGGLRGHLLYPSLSQNGRYIAVPVVEASGTHIWIHDTARSTNSRLTFEQGGTNQRPVWGPRDQVAYSSLTDKSTDILVKPVDGSASAKALLAEATTDFADDWSRDGRYIIVVRIGQVGLDVWYMKLSEDGTVEQTVPFLETPHSEQAPSLSPDGRFVAYASNESGRIEVYVQSFPDPSGKWPVSNDGGSQQRWSHDGKELFYVEGETLISVSISLQPSFSMGRRRKLFSTPELALTTGPQRYDVSPDGKRFVTLEIVEPASNEIRIVENWYEEFREEQD